MLPLIDHNAEEKEPREKSIQEYISLGYLYLLVLGISSYSIFYGFLGINIISYSNILDIMLSPVIIFTDKIVIFIAVIVLSIISYFYVIGVVKVFKRKMDKLSPETDQEKIEKITNNIRKFNAVKMYTPGFFIFCMYIGYATGGGQKVSSRIESGDLKISHEIIYNDEETVSVELIGHNSQYVFYVKEGSKEVTVSPIVGNIKKIQEIKK